MGQRPTSARRAVLINDLSWSYGLTSYGFFTYASYYLNWHALSDAHWAYGRYYSELLDIDGRDDILSEVVRTYLKMPEERIGLTDRTVAAGKTIISLLMQYQNPRALKSLGTLLSRSRNSEVREAARQAIQQFLWISGPNQQEMRATAQKYLAENQEPTRWSQCMEALSRTFDPPSRALAPIR